MSEKVLGFRKRGIVGTQAEVAGTKIDRVVIVKQSQLVPVVSLKALKKKLRQAEGIKFRNKTALLDSIEEWAEKEACKK